VAMPGSGPDVAELTREFLMALSIMILSAKVGGELFARAGQPPVLGELVMGVVLGNCGVLGIPWLEPLKTNTAISVVAEIGVILLLFAVGLESDLGEMLAVGWSSLLAGALGVLVPVVLGYAVSVLFLPDAGWLAHLFVGGTLAATSVGITARVLKDLGASQTREARIILGAAVADDVIGLVVLALVSGLAAAAAAGSPAQGIRWTTAAWILGKACLFLGGAVLAGRLMARPMFAFAARLRVPGALAATSVCFCFLLAALAGMSGLAAIVGAFAAGLVLEPVHYRAFTERGEPPVEELLFPINTLIVPVFFVLMGMRVDLRSFASAPAAGFALLITAAAVAGKQVCGLGVLERGVDRLVVGVGMIPRGEVGLIFAGLGASLEVNGRPLFPRSTFAALVFMVVLTTFMTPPLLQAAFTRSVARKGREESRSG
jgi:Kef-type K+ transport system membrane component KefB